MLGAALLGTHLLLRGFSYVALALGIAFEILGFAGLFSTTALLLVIFVLMAQNLWNIAAAITLAFRADIRSVTKLEEARLSAAS
jgi:hypothetical protein